jgi:hypothetical protein
MDMAKLTTGCETYWSEWVAKNADSRCTAALHKECTAIQTAVLTGDGEQTVTQFMYQVYRTTHCYGAGLLRC